MQGSSDLGNLMSRNKGTKHTFCDKGIYKLYVGSKEFLTMAARWTHDYANSKLLGTITMHTPTHWPHWGSRPGWRRSAASQHMCSRARRRLPQRPQPTVRH